MKRTLSILIFVFLHLNLFGTQQDPDILLYKGDTIHIDTFPLEELMDVDSILKNKILFHKNSKILSSGCWRKHVATWTIQNDSLFLIKVNDEVNNYSFNLANLFPEQSLENEKVFFYWFTGEIKASFGTIIGSNSSKYEDKYSGSFDCNVKNGITNHIIHQELSKIKIDSILNNKWISDSLKISSTVHNFQTLNIRPIFTNNNKQYSFMETYDYIYSRLDLNIKEFNCNKTVVVSLIIEKDGTVSSLKLLRKSCEINDDKIIEVIKKMNTWSPGIKKGIKVRVLIFYAINTNKINAS